MRKSSKASGEYLDCAEETICLGVNLAFSGRKEPADETLWSSNEEAVEVVET